MPIFLRKTLVISFCFCTLWHAWVHRVFLWGTLRSWIGQWTAWIVWVLSEVSKLVLKLHVHDIILELLLSLHYFLNVVLKITRTSVPVLIFVLVCLLHRILLLCTRYSFKQVFWAYLMESWDLSRMISMLIWRKLFFATPRVQYETRDLLLVVSKRLRRQWRLGEILISWFFISISLHNRWLLSPRPAYVPAISDKWFDPLLADNWFYVRETGRLLICSILLSRQGLQMHFLGSNRLLGVFTFLPCVTAMNLFAVCFPSLDTVLRKGTEYFFIRLVPSLLITSIDIVGPKDLI